MATEDEEDDLEALRIAVLASMKSRVAEKENSPQDTGNDTEEDPELAALRAAALKTKGQNSTAKRVASPKFTSHQPLPSKPSHFQYSNRGGRGWGRGIVRGSGRGVPGGFRGGKNGGSNLIVINTVPADGSGSGSDVTTGRQPLQKDASNVFLRPQDKWAGSVSDSNSGTSTPTRSKAPNKFSRFDSSGTDTDSDSDFEEEEKEEKVTKSSENSDTDDDLFSLEDKPAESSESENENKNQDNDEKETIERKPYEDLDENNQIQSSKDEETTGENEKINKSEKLDTLVDSGTCSESVTDKVEVSTDRSSEVSNRSAPFPDVDKVNVPQLSDTRNVVSPVKPETVINNLETESQSSGSRNVKSRLGIQPVRQKVSPDEAPIASSPMAQNQSLKLDAMTPEERKLFEARRKKFMQIMEVQDLKKTVSLKGIVSPKKAKRELPKQYRHKRNRSRSNSQSPSAKVISSHRKRERRKRRESETKSNRKGSQGSKTERKVKTVENSNSDSDHAKTTIDSDSDSSEGGAVPWRFQHTGKSRKQDRHSNIKPGAVFERRAEDIAKERRQRLYIESTKGKEESRPQQRSNAKQRLGKLIPNETQRKRVVRDVSSDRNKEKRPDRTNETSIKSRLRTESDHPKTKPRIEQKDHGEKSKVHVKPSKRSDSSDSLSSSEDEGSKKRDARSIIVSLRTKEEGDTTAGSAEKDKPAKVDPIKEAKVPGRTSPVVNVTFNGPSEKKPKLEQERGPIHRRLGLTVRSKRRSSESRDSSRRNKPARKVIEDDDTPLKFGIRKTDHSLKSRVRPISIELESGGARSRRRVEHDSTDVFIRDRSKSASDIVLTSQRHRSGEKTIGLSSKSTKRKSEEWNTCSDDTNWKKVKLNSDSENTVNSPTSKPTSNHTTERTAEEVLLDERIRKIHERNQEILKRQQEVLKDKKLYG